MTKKDTRDEETKRPTKRVANTADVTMLCLRITNHAPRSVPAQIHSTNWRIMILCLFDRHLRLALLLNIPSNRAPTSVAIDCRCRVASYVPNASNYTLTCLYAQPPDHPSTLQSANERRMTVGAAVKHILELLPLILFSPKVPLFGPVMVSSQKRIGLLFCLTG